jgi:phosphonate transport system substrate-binding protein
MPNLTGQILLKRYRVDVFIAAGSMSSVYKVWDLQRNAALAMKVLHSEVADDTAAFSSFQREAQSLERLAHPNIVPFYGLHHTETFDFLLEGFVDGPSLKDLLRQRQGHPMPVSEALIYLKSLSAALGYAHHRKVVHCDIKPANVMIDLGGRIYLTDFGIARRSEGTTTTLAGAGTPAYMAPEQIRGEAVTPATDIYALGVLLFELITGQRPFRGEAGSSDSPGTRSTTAERIRAGHLTQAPPNPQELNPQLPQGLAKVLLRALEKDPAKRFASAPAFFEAAFAAMGIGQSDVAERINLPGPEKREILEPPGEAGKRDNVQTNKLAGHKKKAVLWLGGVGILVIVALLIFAGLRGGKIGAIRPIQVIGGNSSQTLPAETQVRASISNLSVTNILPTATTLPQSTATASPYPTNTTASTAAPTIIPIIRSPFLVSTTAVAGALGSADNPIVLTFVPSGDTNKITKAGTAIAEFLTRKTGYTFKIEASTSYYASVVAMGTNKAQVGFLNTFSILLAEQKYQIIPALASLRKYTTNDIDPDKGLSGQMEPFYRVQFIANVASGIKTFADLNGKTFCFVDPLSTSGYIIPRIVLKANGIDPDTDFKATVNASSNINVAIAVYKGDCDAGVTYINVLTDQFTNLAATYPDITQKVTIFADTDRIPNEGVQYVKTLDPNIQKTVTNGLLAIAADPNGQSILSSFYNIIGFQEIDSTFYDQFAAVLKEADVDPATLVK